MGFFFNKHQEAGMSLISVMVAAGVTATLAVVAANFWRAQVRNQKTLEIRTDLELLRRRVITEMDCKATLKSAFGVDPFAKYSNGIPKICYNSSGQAISIPLRRRDGTILSYLDAPIMGAYRMMGYCKPSLQTISLTAPISPSVPLPTEITITAAKCGINDTSCTNGITKDKYGADEIWPDLFNDKSDFCKFEMTGGLDPTSIPTVTVAQAPPTYTQTYVPSGLPVQTIIQTYTPAALPVQTITMVPSYSPMPPDYTIELRRGEYCRNVDAAQSVAQGGASILCPAHEYMPIGGGWCSLSQYNLKDRLGNLIPADTRFSDAIGFVHASNPSIATTGYFTGWNVDCNAPTAADGRDARAYVWGMCCLR